MQENTITSKNKTTQQERKGSGSFELLNVKLKSEGNPNDQYAHDVFEGDCPIHGRVEAIRYKMFPSSPIECKHCVDEKQERDRKASEELERQRRMGDKILSYLEASGIPPRFMPATFDNYSPQNKESERCLSFCKKYVEDFQESLNSGGGMILCGNAGTGKTHLACSITKNVIRKHCVSAKFISVSEACRSVKETYNPKSAITERQAISKLTSPALLVLDEVGVQYGSDTEKNILFEIINARYENMRPTILISNLALPALTEYIGERILDRMKQGGTVLTFGWNSYRGMA
jgi:DNA replication protein DnaC